MKEIAAMYKADGYLQNWYTWTNVLMGLGVDGAREELATATSLGMTPEQIADAERESGSLFSMVTANRKQYCQEFPFDTSMCQGHTP